MARSWLALALSLLASSPAVGGRPVWELNGVSVCGTACSTDFFLVAPDGQGGIYVAWRERKDFGTTGSDVYLQRLTAFGEIAPGWPADGLPVSTFPNSQLPMSLAVDSHGSAFIAWQDFRNTSATSTDVYAQKILPNGSIAPGWAAGGVPACQWPGPQGQGISIASDRAGGAWVVWVDGRNLAMSQREDVFAQHLTGLGSQAPGWSAGGLSVSAAPETQTIEPSSLLAGEDGSGVIVWTDCRNGPDCDQSFGQRLLSDGSLAPGWTTDGLLLVDGKTLPNIVSDGAGGFYLVSAVLYPASSSFQNLFVHRFALDGSLHPGWPAEGLQVCCPTPAERDQIRIAEDGTGGVLVSWYDAVPGLNVYASRALPDATVAPGWPPGGVLVSDPAQSSSFEQEIVPDGEGGLLLAWEWLDFTTETTKTRIQHIGPDGEIEPDWPNYGMVVAPTASQCHPKIASDGAGGAIVVWEDGGDLFAQRFVDDDVVQTRPSLVSAEAEEGLVTLVWYAKGAGELLASVERRTEYGPWEQLGAPIAVGPDGLRFEDRSVTAGERYGYRLGYSDGGGREFTEETWVEVPSSLRFALNGFSPNPAVGTPSVSLTLPRAEGARLEVFDLRGRLVFRRDLSSLGAGRHLVSLAGGARLASGVYLARLRQGEQVAQVRGVVLD